MSHNITVNTVKITDLSMLGQIVADLSGGKATLDTAGKFFRAYPGQPTNCDAVIKMPGSYDIGLRKGADGAYTPIFEAGGLNRLFAPDGASMHGGAAIGLLLQEYILREAEYLAAQNGYTTTRVKGERGVVSLEVLAA